MTWPGNLTWCDPWMTSRKPERQNRPVTRHTAPEVKLPGPKSQLSTHLLASLGRLLTLLELQFCHLYNGGNIMQLRVLRGLNELIHVKCAEQW